MNGSENSQVLAARSPGTKADFATDTGSYRSVSADFNDDGKIDLATANFNGNTVSVLPVTDRPGGKR